MQVQAARMSPLRGEAAQAGGVSFDRSLVRPLAWLAIAGQLAFVAAWIIAGALQPGYSHLEQPITELAARNAAHPWIANAGFLLLGISIASLAPGLLATLPSRPATRVAAALFAVAGAALALHAAFPLDCGLSVDKHCIAQWHAGRLSWRTDAHIGAGIVFELAFVLTPFAIARALWPAPVGTLAFGCGVSGVVILVATAVSVNGAGAADGLVERLGFVPVHLWVVIVAVGLLHALPSEESGALVPTRPRDFFGHAWRGEGRVLLWPPFLWRRLAQRFEFRRESEWLNEEAWTVEDRATFDGGPVISRKMFAEAVAPDVVHVTADDMPRGADLRLEEDGYRVAPYRLAVPIGPVRFTLRVRDEVRVSEPPGALDWTIHFRWLGLPVARIEGRVEPVREADPIR